MPRRSFSPTHPCRLLPLYSPTKTRQFLPQSAPAHNARQLLPHILSYFIRIRIRLQLHCLPLGPKQCRRNNAHETSYYQHISRSTARGKVECLCSCVGSSEANPNFEQRTYWTIMGYSRLYMHFKWAWKFESERPSLVFHLLPRAMSFSYVYLWPCREE